jgi:hypothetical protein
MNAMHVFTEIWGRAHLHVELKGLLGKKVSLLGVVTLRDSKARREALFNFTLNKCERLLEQASWLGGSC